MTLAELGSAHGACETIEQPGNGEDDDPRPLHRNAHLAGDHLIGADRINPTADTGPFLDDPGKKHRSGGKPDRKRNVEKPSKRQIAKAPISNPDGITTEDRRCDPDAGKAETKRWS